MRMTARAILGSLLFALLMFEPAHAGAVHSGAASHKRNNVITAARAFLPLAEKGHAKAQTSLGFLYSTGRGVPQNYMEAARWFQRAAEQGDPTAQYMLGLMYDKGHGVRQNYIEAHKWLNLATANTRGEGWEYSARLRNAVATKMTRGELAMAQVRALEWAPAPER
jgi:TPR repeat protein